MTQDFLRDRKIALNVIPVTDLTAKAPPQNLKHIVPGMPTGR